MTEVHEITTWFIATFGNSRAAHMAYRAQLPGGQEILMTYCGIKLATPVQAPDDRPRCKSCLRSRP